MYKNLIHYKRIQIINHYKNNVNNLITFTYNKFKINFMYYLETYVTLVCAILFFASMQLFWCQKSQFFSSQFLFSASKSLDTIEIRISQTSVTPLELTS